MKPTFVLTNEQLRDYRRRAGKAWAKKQKMDKAFGWTKRSEVRTRLSSVNPAKNIKKESV